MPMANSSPRAADLTLKLPAELLLQIFDGVFTRGDAYLALRGPGAVCSRWRALALSHPVFSRQIDFWQTRPGMMNLFLAQLAAGESSGASFELSLSNPPFDVLTMLLPHVVKHMARCLSICLIHNGAASQWRGFLDALHQRPAPRLQTLKLFLILNTSLLDAADGALNPVQISETIFCGHAPQLRSVNLMGPAIAMIKPGVSIPAFAAVESVMLDSSTARYKHTTPYSAFSAFPSLRLLTVYGGQSLPPPDDAGLLADLKLDRVKLMDISISWEAAISAIDLARIPELHVGGDPDNHDITAGMLVVPYITPLRAPLCLSIRQDDHRETIIVLRARQHNRTLIIDNRFKSGRPVSLRWKSTLAFIFPRVTRVEVWYRARYFLFDDISFPGANTLALYFDGLVVAEARPPTWAAFPALREVMLHMCPVTPDVPPGIDANLVAAFLGPVLAAVSPPSLVVKRPLELVGDRTLLLNLVREISEI